MLIDFHTHLFPDAVAPRAVAALMEGTLRIEGRALPPRGEATECGILSAMAEECVPLSVVLPIVTRPAQFESILAFAEALNRRNEEKLAACKRAFLRLQSDTASTEREVPPHRAVTPVARFRSLLPNDAEKTFFASLPSPALLSFASVHPDDPKAEDQLALIAERGFRGIKLHPEFQHFEIASPRVISLLERAESLNLYTVIHAGRDIGMPPPAHGAPESIAHVLEYISGNRLIAAHLGGFRMWEDVQKYLVGKPLFLDTAYLGLFDGEPTEDTYLQVVRAHGAERILFGSDYPWKSAREVSARLTSLGLSDAECASILYLNACRLLSITE